MTTLGQHRAAPTGSTLALFALAALALIAIPGPNMVYVATRSMSEGRRSGYASALGLLTGTMINVAAAAAGLSALIASSATAFNVLKYLGAAYLVYLGVKALLQRGERGRRGRRQAGLAGPRVPAGDRRPAPEPEGRAVLPRLPAAVRRPRPRSGGHAGAGPGRVLGALGFLMDCGYALAAGAAASKLGGFRHGQPADRRGLHRDGRRRGADRVAPLILEGDNLPHLRALEDGIAQMVYADPPFNTGRTQTRRSLATVPTVNGDGDRTGFGGRRYATKLLSESSYKDVFDDYLAFLEPRLTELWRVLAPTGTLYLHLDYREAHYVKIFLDELFGRDEFPQRADLGVRLWREAEGPLATETRHDPGVRQGRARTTSSTPRRSTASRTWRPGW